MKIAIDGPAGAGKSSIAKLVAKKLSFVYVDTGAMFRTVAYYFLSQGKDPSDAEMVTEECEKISISIEYKDGAQHIFLDGTDVSTEIRQEEVGKNASVVAKNQAVRNRLLALQRQMAEKQDVIMDGRDIGTVVLPDAQVKIYLTASASVRAERRYKELVEKGETCNLKKIEEDIIARDEQDMNREIAPLKQAEDAVLVDSSYMTIEEVVDKIIEIVEKVQ
ncbi:cytidylate kinase [Clostridium sp. CAG:167]|jgi:cytidylate kinase|nr:cytidylate kinase [Clostridium sp. CAG:167]